MKNKIALFLPSLHGGGAERVMINLAKGFFERGYSVDLVVSNAAGPYLSQIPKGVSIIDLKSHRVLKSLFPLMSYLRKEKPNIFISALNHTNIIAIIAKEVVRSSTLMIITEHNTLSIAQKHALNLREKMLPILMKYFYPLANQIIAVSQGVAKDLSYQIGLPLHKIKVIYNPVIDDQLIKKSWEKVEHPWFHQYTVILSVGRLTEQKDYPTLIKVFAQVRKKVPAKLMILGEGEKRLELEQLIDSIGLKEDVCMPGFVENPYAYMRRSKVFILSSKWEGLPTVLIEAMACGCQVVSTNCPSGPAEILEDGKWGRLVPVGDVDALARAILLSLNDDRGRGVQRAQFFSIKNIIAQYEQIFTL